jgi:hypothetical protein
MLSLHYIEPVHVEPTQLAVDSPTRALHWVPIPCPCPGPPMSMGFGWAWMGIGFVHPCIQFQIGVKLLGYREYTNQEALRAEAIDSLQLFICPIQPRLGVGG